MGCQRTKDGKLQIIVLSIGEVDLLGLSLKRAALDRLDLPIDVKEGRSY